MLPNGERGREPRRFNAVERDIGLVPGGFGPLDDKVGLGLIRSRGLRPDPRIGGDKRFLRKLRPIAANGGIEGPATRWVYVVVDIVHPLQIGAEPRLTAEIEGEVSAKATRLGHWIDQVLEG